MHEYDSLRPEQQKLVDRLLADTEANGGLAPLDVGQFWKDQDDACRKGSFDQTIAQPPFGASCNWECVFDELGIPVDYQRYLNDPVWASDVARRYNDVAERTVGRRLVPETVPDPALAWPRINGLPELFEAQNVWEGGAAGSWWLKQCVDTPEDLAALLDRVERKLENPREAFLPENWDEEKARLVAAGARLPLYRHQRGPCTFACSIFGAENMLLLHFDDPALFVRFGETIARAIVARAELIDAEAGVTPETDPLFWSWADDNCCLFTPEMYEAFAMPIHRAVLGRFAPAPEHRRRQHSDSAMGHLLPLLSEIDLTWANFGPTLSVSEIRRHLPHADIFGQLAPFTYCRNESANIVASFIRDFEQALPARGLTFACAGSINNGTSLASMRLAMAAIQRFGRY